MMINKMSLHNDIQLLYFNFLSSAILIIKSPYLFFILHCFIVLTMSQPDKNDDDDDLYEAADAGDYDKCQMILQRGHCSREGKNVALLEVSLFGRTNITRLLHESGADIDTRDDIGSTPIICAAQQGKVDTVKYLVQAGADKNADNNQGVMAIHMASQNNRVEVVEYLIREAGVNPDVVSDQQ